MAAPVLGAQNVPGKVKLVMALAVTIMVAPLLPPMPSPETFSYQWFMIIFYQVLIGLVIGTAFQLIFAAVITAGQIIAMQMGLGFATMVDPQNGAQVPVLSQFYLIFTTLIFLALDGHLLMISTIVESFRVIPVGMEGITPAGFRMMAEWGSTLFATALWMSLSAVGALLLINISFGVMSRAAPQLQIFAIGFPITLMMGFVVMLYSVSVIVGQFSAVVDETILLIGQILEAG